MKNGARHFNNSSSRILDTYINGLRAEVARLSLMRDHSEDAQWQSQLDSQIELKLQLIDDIAQCLDFDDAGDSIVEFADNSLLILPTARPAVS